MSYQPDFSGIWAKLDRAKQHTDTLNNEIGYVYDAAGNPVIAPNNRVPMRLKYDPDTGYHVFRTTTRHSDAAIQRWGLITGDAAHNLRCALDHLVWQLSLHGRNGLEPRDPEGTKFPILDRVPSGINPEDFAKNRALREVLPEHRAIIYAHQPNGGRFDFGYGGMHPFIRLREITNHDKHRVITPVLVGSERYSIPEGIFSDFGGEIIEDEYVGGFNREWLLKRNAEIVRMKVRPASLQVNMEVDGYVAPTVMLPDIPVGKGIKTARIDLISALQFMGAQVSMVIREFEPLF